MRDVPVVALTGYLGSGKTTVLNHLLQRPGARLGVVVNDVGDVNVDAALVAGQAGDLAPITGGCLCCLPDAGGLDEALETLTRPQLRLDAVLVETSGVADPLAVARLIRFSGVERVRPGGVVEVVDAAEFFRTVDTGRSAPVRFAAASLVVLNKTDRLADDEREAALTRIERRVRQVNPRVHVVRAVRGRVDPALVVDVAATSDPDDELPLASLSRRRDAHDHEHADAVTALAAGPVEPGALIDLLEDPPERVYRLKGRVAVDTGRALRGYVVNAVGRSIHVAAHEPAEPGGPGRPDGPAGTAGELVAVGMRLDVPAVRSRLAAALRPAGGRASAAGLRRLQRYRRLSV